MTLRQSRFLRLVRVVGNSFLVYWEIFSIVTVANREAACFPHTLREFGVTRWTIKKSLRQSSVQLIEIACFSIELSALVLSYWLCASITNFSVPFLRCPCRSHKPFHSFRVKWVKCAKDFRKIEGQQIRQVVSLTERCIIEGWETKIWSTYLLSIKSYSLLFNSM